MHEHGQQETAVRVRIKPGDRNREGSHSERPDREGLAVFIGSLKKKQRQVPQRPDHANDKARSRISDAGSDSGQRIAPPSDFFAGLEWRGDHDRNENDNRTFVTEARPGA